MKINKSSWHYRLIVWAKIAPSKNLCDYFWQIIGSMLLAIALAALAGMAVAVLVGGIAVFILPFYFDVFSEEIPWWVDLLMSFGSLFWILAVMLTVDKVITFFKSRRYRKERFKATKILEPSLIAEYIKAKKQKACPMIEFDGDE